MDEAVSLNEAKLPSWRAVIGVIQSWDQGKPPLYFLALHSWLKWRPATEFWLRVPSVAFAGLSVVGMFFLGTRLFGSNVAALSCVLLSVNPFFISMAAWARMYSLLLLLTVASSYFLHRIVCGDGRPLRTVLYSLSLALLLYVHYFAFLVVAAHGAYVMAEHRAALRRVCLALAVALASYLPWAGITFRQVHSGSSVRWTSTPTVWNLLGVFKHFAGSELLAALLLPFFILGLVRGLSSQRVGGASPVHSLYDGGQPHIALAIAWLFVPVVTLFVVCWTVTPVYSVHYLLFVLPAFLWITAVGVYGTTSTWRRPLVAAFVAAAVILSVVELGKGGDLFARPDYRPVARYIQSVRQDGDWVAVENPAWRLVYSFYDPVTPTFGVAPGLLEALVARLANQGHAVISTRRLWLATAEGSRELNGVEPAARFDMVRVYLFPQALLDPETDTLASGFP